MVKQLSPAAGALAGALVTVGFVVLHGVVIADIWFNAMPMIVSGALCGVCMAWSYNTLAVEHSTSRWLAYNGACIAALSGLGFASIIAMEPQFTMVEILAMDDPLGRLMPLALVPMILGTVAATAGIWLVFGRKGASLIPILVTQALLMFLIGHNLAIMGAVEIPSSMLYLIWEFVGLTLFLGAGFALTALLVTRLRIGQSEPA